MEQAGTVRGPQSFRELAYQFDPIGQVEQVAEAQQVLVQMQGLGVVPEDQGRTGGMTGRVEQFQAHHTGVGEAAQHRCFPACGIVDRTPLCFIGAALAQVDAHPRGLAQLGVGGEIVLPGGTRIEGLTFQTVGADREFGVAAPDSDLIECVLDRLRALRVDAVPGVAHRALESFDQLAHRVRVGAVALRKFEPQVRIGETDGVADEDPHAVGCEQPGEFLGLLIGQMQRAAVIPGSAALEFLHPVTVAAV